MQYRVSPETVWFPSAAGLVVVTAKEAHVFELEEPEPVIAFLERLRRPTERAALEEALDEDTVEELLGVLLDIGALQTIDAPVEVRSPSLLRALEAGCTVVRGASAAAQAVADEVVRALSARGIASSTDADPKLVRGQVVIGCFASLFDGGLLALNRRALEAGAWFLPVILDGPNALVGPLVVDDAPCARCLCLRVLAHREPALYAAWLETQGSEPPASVGTDDRHAPFAAAHVARFLAALDDEQTLGGTPHALLRVELASGVSDVHRVLRHSHCVACGPRPVALVTPSEDTLQAAAAAVERHWERILTDDPEGMRPEPHIEQMYRDPLVGLLQHGEDWDHRESYFRNLPETWGGMALCREREWVSTNRQGINGTGPDLEHLRLVMLSEGIERYGQYNHRPAVTGASYRELGEHAFDPRQLTLYDEEQYAHPDFPLRRFHEDLKLNWSWGYGLFSRRAKLFPQEVMTVAIQDHAYPNRILDQRLTTGGASHVSYTRALNNCLRELIERDQLMIAWYKRVPLPRVELPTHTGNDYVDGLLEFLRRSGVRLDLFDMRLDFDMPAFLLLGTVETRQGDFHPLGTVGAAAGDLNPITALGKTLGEMRIHYETLAMTPNDMKDYRKNPYDPHDMRQGWQLWWPNYMWHLNPENRRAFDFLYDGELARTARPFASIESRDRGDPLKDRDELLAMFERVGLEPWAWDLGCEETSHSGFRVVKVEVPGLVHLVPGRQSRRLACPRFEAVAASMGRPCLPPGEQNPDPHVQA